MKKVKARIEEPSARGFQVVIFIAGLWRVFGTPYSQGKDILKPYKTKKSAMRAADSIATTMGLTLEWED